MRKTPIILYKIQNYLMHITCDNDGNYCQNNISSEHLYSEDVFSKLTKDKTYFGVDLQEITQIQFCNVKYVYKEFDEYLLFVPAGILFNLSKKRLRQARNVAETAIYKFKFETRRNLIDKISTRKCDLKKFISAICEYVFYDSYSLWIFNKETDYFTLSFSSITLETKVILKSENCTLNRVLNEDYTYELRGLEDSNISEYANDGMLSLFRIKLVLGETVGVLTLFSKRNNILMDDTLVHQVQALIESKYHENLSANQEALAHINNELQINTDFDNFIVYLKRAAEIISTKLEYEACSIWIVTPDKSSLFLAATYDKNGINENGSKVEYDLSISSMTTSVVNNKEVMFSYDLKNDSRNSGVFNEETEHDGVNWIGMPLTFKENIFGMLRVKNKFCLTNGGVKSIIPPRPIDFLNLKTIAAAISNFTSGHSMIRHLSEKYDQLELFNKVFMHEVRTPISKFNMGPELIKRKINTLEIDEDAREKIDKQLKDIQVLGNRLKFLTDSYSFNEITEKKDMKNLSLLQDILYPVLTLTLPYQEKLHDVTFNVDHSSMHGWKIFGDQEMLTMVLNSLIDNAAKYSEGSPKVINIYCKYNYGDEYLYLYVSNKGLEILENEQLKIFERDYRGEKAIKTKVHGTGIGLFLSKSIMLAQGGDLELITRDNPICFCMKIRSSAEMRRNM